MEFTVVHTSRTLFGALFCSLTLLTLAACSSSSGGGGGGTGSGPAKSKEEAIARLSPQHRQAFEAWKQSLIKSCDASLAFGLGGEGRAESEGVDGHVLMQSSEGSML